MTTRPILLIAQAVAVPGAMPATPPDVELSARVEAREVRIEQDGPIRLELRAEPGVTDMLVLRSQPAGARSYRDLVIDARVAAWLGRDSAAPVTLSTAGSTGEPQP